MRLREAPRAERVHDIIRCKQDNTTLEFQWFRGKCIISKCRGYCKSSAVEPKQSKKEKKSQRNHRRIRPGGDPGLPVQFRTRRVIRVEVPEVHAYMESEAVQNITVRLCSSRVGG